MLLPLVPGFRIYLIAVPHTVYLDTTLSWVVANHNAPFYHTANTELKNPAFNGILERRQQKQMRYDTVFDRFKHDRTIYEYQVPGIL